MRLLLQYVYIPAIKVGESRGTVIVSSFFLTANFHNTKYFGAWVKWMYLARRTGWPKSNLDVIDEIINSAKTYFIREAVKAWN